MRRLSPLSLATLVSVAGCGGEGGSSLSGGTAIVAVDSTSFEFDLDRCGLDGQTLRLSGEDESGATIAASFDVQDDDQTALVETSAITLSDVDGVDLVGYGPEAWARRGETGDPPGDGLNARISGELIQMAGQIAVVDEDEEPIGEFRTLVLDSTCDKG